MFILVFVSNILINVDHGSLPGCSVIMKKDLDMTNLQFGMLGSVVYAGMTFGSTAAAGLYEKAKWIKMTLAFTLLLNSVCLVLFTVTDSFYFDGFIRFWIGFFQVFQCIYMPVWADNFAAEKQKAAWLTFLILASVLGIVIGFSLTSVMVTYLTWRWSFYAQASALLPCVCGYLLYPTKYLNIEASVSHKNKCKHVVL